MAHYRQQIREAVATLVTGLSTTGTNVYQSRVRPVETAYLPALSIYTDGEEVGGDNQSDEGFSTMGDHTVVDIATRIQIRARAASDLDDTLDTILGEIQVAIDADVTLSGKAYRAVYAGISDPELLGDGDQEIGLVVVTYNITTGFDPSDPETITL